MSTDRELIARAIYGPDTAMFSWDRDSEAMRQPYYKAADAVLSAIGDRLLPTGLDSIETIWCQFQRFDQHYKAAVAGFPESLPPYERPEGEGFADTPAAAIRAAMDAAQGGEAR